jgi:hypothetical protein
MSQPIAAFCGFSRSTIYADARLQALSRLPQGRRYEAARLRTGPEGIEIVVPAPGIAHETLRFGGERE